MRCSPAPYAPYGHWAGVRLRLLSLALLLSLSACDFDQDGRYVVQPRAAYYLAEDLPGIAGKIVVRLRDTGINDYRQQLGFPLVHDMVLEGSLLWMTAPRTQELIVADVTQDRVTRRYTLDFAPLYVAPGEETVLLTDSLSHSLAFLDRRSPDGQLVRETRSQPPGRPLHLSERFFIPLGDSLLQMVNARSLAVEGTYRLAGKLLQLSVNANLSISCLLRVAGGQAIQVLTPTTRQLSLPTPVPYEALRTSPLLYARFSTEWLTDVTRTRGRLNLSTVTDTVLNYDVDWRFGRLLYRSPDDSVRLVDIRSGQRFTTHYQPRNITAAYFFADDAR